MLLRRLLHSALCLCLLAVLAACEKQESQSSGPSRVLEVNVGIALTRAGGEGTLIGDDSQPDDLRLWMFAGAKCLDYVEIEEPGFSGSDALNELVHTIQRVVEVDGEIGQLDFYVVLNGEGLNLGESSTPERIKSATFTRQDWEGDNQVPIYGYATLDVSGHRGEYSVSIEATRAVGKLELFFTKENAQGYLKINDVELKQMPTVGYLVEGEHALTYDGTANLFSGGKEITSHLTKEEASLGSFSQHPGSFDRLLETYLLENKGAGSWTSQGADFIYVQEQSSTGTPYVMTVTYQLSENSEERKKEIYLPAIIRNEWTKIFARVQSGVLTLEYKVLPWNKVESGIGWYPEFEYGSHAPMAAWRIADKKIDADFKDATAGDEEAACCYLLYPRFGRTADNKSDHNKLENPNKPSYAAFYFKLNKPAGAIWEAYLTNPDDFEFAFGGYDINGDGVSDRKCVITGIARDEPYQIQVTAKHAWTEPRYEGDEEFWDNNTEWGAKVEASGECYNIYTDLYIRISTDGGYTWHNLKINPVDTYIQHCYWKEQRRFAGGDYFIRIWQLKAEKGKAFDKLVNDLEEDWAIKDYWVGYRTFY